MKHYQHLGTEERFYIWQALREGNTQQQIAEALGRHPSNSQSRTQTEYLSAVSCVYLSLGQADRETSKTRCESTEVSQAHG